MFRCFFFFQAEDGIRDLIVTGVQTCALPISTRCGACWGIPPSGRKDWTTGWGVSKCRRWWRGENKINCCQSQPGNATRSEEHTSELQSRSDLVCRLLLEKKKKTARQTSATRC